MSACHIVPGRRIMRSGYPYAYWRSPSGRRYEGAHRVALAQALWRTEGRDIYPDHEAAHRCGNKRCERVGPDHVYEATRSENHGRDKREQGTLAAGERSGTARLTWADVATIRACYRPAGRPGQRTGSHTLARLYGITPQQIRKIARGLAWKE